MNVIARLEYELTYYDSAVHRFNHYTTRTPPKRYEYQCKILFLTSISWYWQQKLINHNTIINYGIEKEGKNTQQTFEAIRKETWYLFCFIFCFLLWGCSWSGLYGFCHVPWNNWFKFEPTSMHVTFFSHLRLSWSMVLLAISAILSSYNDS